LANANHKLVAQIGGQQLSDFKRTWVDYVLNGIMEPNEQAYRNFRHHADRLCFLIVGSDCSDREIDIERLHLRVQAATLFPEKMPLYDMVYESRFRRLRQQFRKRP